MLRTKHRKPTIITAMMAVVVAIMTTTTIGSIPVAPVFANGDGTHAITVYGEVELAEGGKLIGVHIIDTSGDTPQGISPALDTRGSATIQGVLIENASAGVYAGAGSKDSARFRFWNNVIQGDGNSSGLVLDVHLGPGSSIARNTFESQRCGINISIDVVFKDLPQDERFEAFEHLAEQLETMNIFVDVDQPICGGRG